MVSDVAYAMPVCVLHIQHVNIVVNQCADAITDYSQSANDINSYFKSQLGGGTGHRKPVLISPNGLCKPGNRVDDRNAFHVVVRFEPTTY